MTLLVRVFIFELEYYETVFFLADKALDTIADRRDIVVAGYLV